MRHVIVLMGTLHGYKGDGGCRRRAGGAQDRGRDAGGHPVLGRQAYPDILAALHWVRLVPLL